MKGVVVVASQPVADATVTLWKTSGKDAPEKLLETTTNTNGEFVINGVSAGKGEDVFYLTSSGGSEEGLSLMLVLGTNLPEKVVVNELTTVASVFTNAQFINGTAISGNKLGLRIAAGNVPNLANLETGSWGDAIVDANNANQSTTLSKLNTLANLVALGAISDKAEHFKQLLELTSTNGKKNLTTLDAMQSIAKTTWENADKIFALFEASYPIKDARRPTTYLPYLLYAPDDFALILRFSVAGAPGRIGIDNAGNIWSGQNWMPASQSGVVNNLGGGTINLNPNGKTLSPPILGYTGMDVDGIGWGTGVTNDAVWVGGFNGAVGVMDFEGRPLGKESDFPYAGKVGNLMGVGVAANGDVWIADGTKDQLLYFPGGRIKDQKLVKVKGLASPFGIAIDSQNRVWVSNSASTEVVRFPADDPSKVESFRAGISVRGVALDSKGNLWAASNMSLDFPPPKIPKGVSIMEQFELILNYMAPKMKTSTTGVVNMIRPDGTQPAPMGFTGNNEVVVPWGVSIDGNDDVWVGNFWGRGVVLLAGDDTKGHPEGTKTGDLIHTFQSGVIQMVTDVSIDPAGNVWVANNWDNFEAVGDNPSEPISTKGVGSGIVVIYGVASPVKTPVLGQVEKP